MGLFVAEDGRYQGWLAAFLCCCAAVDVDEHPTKENRPRREMSFTPVHQHNAAPAPSRVCYGQPLLLTALPALPASRSVHSTSNHDESIVDCYPLEKTLPISEQPPSLKPLELSNSPLLGRPSHRRNRRSSSSYDERPSVSAPGSYRRHEYTKGQRATLVPLRLGPVVLKEMPVAEITLPPRLPETSTPPPARERSDSTQGPLTMAYQRSCRTSRGQSVHKCDQKDYTVPLGQRDSISQLSTTARSLVSPVQDRRAGRPWTSTPSLADFPQRQTVEVGASSTPLPPPNEPHRSRRQSSRSSAQRPCAGSGESDVDKEILDLNTIVEDGKAEATRWRDDDASTHQHIAAIAPTLHARMRPETLRAIGSGLARPLIVVDTDRRRSVFEKPATPTEVSTVRMRRTRPSSRVSGWLSGLVSSHVSSPGLFYRSVAAPSHRARAYSEASLCSSATVPSLTPPPSSSSSATFKAHSRSLTAESRVTLPLPLNMTRYGGRELCADARKRGEEQWPPIMSVER